MPLPLRHPGLSLLRSHSARAMGSLRRSDAGSSQSASGRLPVCHQLQLVEGRAHTPKLKPASAGFSRSDSSHLLPGPSGVDIEKPG